MIAALRVTWRGLVQFERYGWLYVGLNLLTAVLSIPLVTAPAAYAGLCHVSYSAQTNLTTSLSDYWEGFRANLGRGLIVGVANIAILGMLYSNLIYYADRSGVLFFGLRIVWLIIFITVISVEFYLWPILEEMEQPNLREGLRNALLMTLANPLFTLQLLITVFLLLAISISTVLPLFLIALSLTACLSTTAVLDRFEQYRARRAQSPIGDAEKTP